uniref:serine/threonine-protein phosphatase 4 regulatory subunit 1 isoform X2 n=1 Tax=Myxine glutinosa TaxID=7769 RepID=UPI00358E2CDE
MADLSLFQEEAQDGYSGCIAEFGPECDPETQLSVLDVVIEDEMLTPLARLEKFAASDNIFNRQLMARTLPDTLRLVLEADGDVWPILNTVTKLAEDAEPAVRATLMEQLPHVAALCQKHNAVPPHVIPQHLLPILVRFLKDGNNQVRKASQAALLELLGQEHVSAWDVETFVCPAVLELTAPDSCDDYKAEAVAIMCSVAAIVGREVTERLLLPRFCELCGVGRIFHVRKVCAASFGDMCNVVGQSTTEKVLLPHFVQLCSDGVWGVRKACAECFAAISCASSLDVRRVQLSPLFINLTCDPSRWVRMAAFQSLGPFISTFARVESTQAECTEDRPREYEKQHVGAQPTVLENDHFKDKLTDEAVIGARDGGVEDVQVAMMRNGLSDMLRTSSAMISSTHHLLNRQGGAEQQKETSSAVQGNNTAANKVQRLTGRTCCDEGGCDLGQGVSLEKDSDAGQMTESLWKSRAHEGTSEKWDLHLPRHLIHDSNAVTLSIGYSVSDPMKAALPFGTSEVMLEQCQTSRATSGIEKSEAAYSSFLYWRDPLPCVTHDLEFLNQVATNCRKWGGSGCTTFAARELNREPVRWSVGSSQPSGPNCEPTGVPCHCSTTAEATCTTGVTACEGELDEQMNTAGDAPNFENFTSTLSKELEALQTPVEFEAQKTSVDVSNSPGSEPQKEFADAEQDVIPPELLAQFVSMTDPTRAQNVDTEIARHCAYSLPGVAFALGREHWRYLRRTFSSLAADMQWKVRRTLAFSIHELALILGDQVTAADLVPIFNGFLKDLDDVRVGVLRHMHDFLKLLPEQKRREYLYHLQEFLVTDNIRNWRFRYDLGEQLILLLRLYTAPDVYDHLCPIAICLCVDHVAEVRWISHRLVGEIIRKLAAVEGRDLADSLLSTFLLQLVEKFCHSGKWIQRKTFVHICQTVLDENCLSTEDFSRVLLPSLLSLSIDPVPNIRLLLARTLQRALLLQDFLSDMENVYQDVAQTLGMLQRDRDPDVKFFASIPPSTLQSSTDDSGTSTRASC